jgi:DNA-binding GntR family transcriptional regulator
VSKPISSAIDFESEPRRRAAGMWVEIANSLQRDIILGRLKPREHLIEDDIMARTETSRHAVRRAFEEMERNGLVVRQPNKGVRVRSYTLEEIENLYEVRETLEMKAAGRIKLPASDTLIKKLTVIQTKHERAAKKGDVVQLFELNNEFHETIYGACGNVVLEEAIKTYALLTHPIRMRHMSEKSWREEAVRQHWAIINLLTGKDRKALVTLCRDHLQPTKLFYLSVNVLATI